MSMKLPHCRKFSGAPPQEANPSDQSIPIEQVAKKISCDCRARIWFHIAEKVMTSDTRFAFLRPRLGNLKATEPWSQALQIVVGFLGATKRTVTLDTVSLELEERAETEGGAEEPNFPSLRPNPESFRERVERFVQRGWLGEQQPADEEEESS
jgi:hypothetical protein